VASRETAGKIHDSIEKSRQGADISGKVAARLHDIAEKTRRVDELIAGIAGASREQSQGISQINTAVTQMDKVTQANAATAEESASATVELKQQAEAMDKSVRELLSMVGHAAGSCGGPTIDVHHPVQPPNSVTMCPPVPEGPKATDRRSLPPSVSAGRRIAP
jgi:ABC-type transporter Mla subunit MlaD